MELIRKSINFEIKEFQPDKREVTFYFARKNIPDLQSDIFTAGSMVVDFKNLRHFKNHDDRLLIGKILSIDEDNSGFYATSKILPTTLGNDTLIEYQEGAINQHSVGGYVIDYSYDLDGYRLIKAFKLMEISTLTSWAAQPDTPVIDIKQYDYEFLNKVLEKLNNVKL